MSTGLATYIKLSHIHSSQMQFYLRITKTITFLLNRIGITRSWITNYCEVCLTLYSYSTPCLFLWYYFYIPWAFAISESFVLTVILYIILHISDNVNFGVFIWLLPSPLRVLKFLIFSAYWVICIASVSLFSVDGARDN